MDASVFVLDTSAVVAVLEDEPDATAVIDLLARAANSEVTVLLPFLALMEAEYILLRRLQPERAESALSVLSNWPVTMVESNEEWRHEAARIKADGGLSLADSWMAALAMLSDAQLVHKDNEFDKLTELKSVRL